MAKQPGHAGREHRAPALLGFCLLIVAQAQAATHYVSQTGTSLSPYTNWVTAATNIQMAVNVATNGSKVVVGDGAYMLTASVTVTNGITIESLNGAEGAIIDGSGAVRCVYLQHTGAVVRGFTIRRGVAVDGAGVYCSAGLVERCVITGNTASQYGGGMRGGRAIRCTISSNMAWRGAGISATLADSCTIQGNAASNFGGGVGDSTTSNCNITGNSALNGGGISGTGTHDNDTITDNTASDSGGGVFFTTIRNCIIYYNRVGGSVNNYHPSGNTFLYCCTTPGLGGTGNISDPPGLLGFNNPHIFSGSACIDKGSMSYVGGDFDIDGEPRIWGGGVDMGCDEFYALGVTGALAASIAVTYDRAVVGFTLTFTASIDGKAAGSRWQMGDTTTFSNLPAVSYAYAGPGDYDVVLTTWNAGSSAAATTTVHVFPGYTNYVALTGSHAHPYTNWAMASTTLQAAVAASIPGTVILVDTGIYERGGAAVSGNLTNRIAITNAVVVRSAYGPAQTFINGAGPAGSNAVRCAYVGGTAQLIGFTLTNGHTQADWGLGESLLNGGGAWCVSGAVISNCTLTGNTAFDDGGGAYAGTLRNCTLAGNAAGGDGGAAAGCTVHDSLLSGNTCGWDGGGAFGGLLVNCVITSNSADYGGGAGWATNTHCTIVQNSALSFGGGVYRCSALNSIVYYNSADAGWDDFFNSVAIYCCTTPDPDAPGSIIATPAFRNLAGQDYRLAEGSPCVDAGRTNSTATDFHGRPRAIDGDANGSALPDMGAFERVPAFYVAPGGAHAPPFVTWSNAAHDIQSAVDQAQAGELVLVSNAVYQSGGRIAAGTATNRLAVSAGVTVRSVNGPANAVIAGSGPLGDAAVRCAYLQSNAVLAGFTLSNGFTRTAAPLVDLLHDVHGGGAYCEDGVTISNCIVACNAAADSGGGVYAAGSDLRNCVLAHNSARTGGGTYGGDLKACTVVYNSVSNQGGGVFLAGLVNSIVYYNAGTAGYNNVILSTGTYTCTESPILPGTGNTALAPGFVSSNDLHLAGASPCIDAGTDTGLPVDLEGTPRPLDGDAAGGAAHDMGAYEFVHPDADSDGDGLSDTNELYGIGTNPAKADTDGDRQGDGEEVIAGVNPLDAGAFFAVSQMGRGGAPCIVTWAGVTGRLYTVASTTSLVPGWWTDIPGQADLPGLAGAMAYTNVSPAAREYFDIKVRLAP